MSNLNTKTEVITPTIAKRWLEKNTGNRPMKEHRVQYFINEIKKDQFHLNGEAIKFSKDGRLLDGQHRLEAVCRTGKTIQSLVVFGLEEKVFQYLDLAKPRSGGDTLAVAGCSDPNNMSAMIKFHHYFKKGDSTKARGGMNSDITLTNHEVLEFYEKHKESLEYSLNAAGRAKSNLVSKSKLGAIHYALKQKSFGEAEAFIQSFGDGANLNKTSPIYALRVKLTNEALKKDKGYRLSDNHLMAFFIKAWNAYRKGKPMKALTYNPSAEQFPIAT